MTSRTARTWFTLYFVPVLPGTVHRLIDMCPRCDKGTILSMDLYLARVEGQTADLRKRFLAGDRPAGLERARTLLSHALYAAARRQADEVMAGGAESPEAREVAAEAAARELRETHRVARARRSLLSTAGGLLMTLVLALVWWNSYASVVVDNPSAAPLALTLDGEPWLTVEPRSHVETRLRRGEHALAGRAGPVAVSPMALALDAGFIANAWAQPTYLIDPLGLGFYVEGTVVYGGSEQGERRDHACERIITMNGLTDVMRDPPRSLKLGRSEVARRRYVKRDPAPPTPEQVARWLLREGRPEEAASYARAVIETETGPATYALLAALGRASDQTDATLAFESWCAARATTASASIPYHRVRIQRLEGDVSGLLREYRAAAEAHPACATAHYGIACLAPSAEETLREHRAATALDPALFEPRDGASEALLSLGRWDEALEAARGAAALVASSDPALALETFAEAAFSARRWDAIIDALAPSRDRVLAYKDGRGAFLAGRVEIARGAEDDAWTALRNAARGALSEPAHLRDLEVERARFRCDAAEVSRLLTPGAAHLETPRPIDEARVWIAAAEGDLGAAHNALEALWSETPPGYRPLFAALRFAVAAEWTGALEPARAWRKRILDEETGAKCERRALALARADGDPAGEALRAIDPLEIGTDADARGLACIAQALRAATPAERASRLDLAVRVGAYEMTESALWARWLTRLGAPAPAK